MSSTDQNREKALLKQQYKEYLVLGFVLVLYVMSYLLFPVQAEQSTTVASDYLKEMVLIIPPVFVLMGLFEVWVPKHFIEKNMGEKSGFRGLILSFVFGTLPAGPIYVAFPLAITLYNKGARVRNIVIFLGVWAAAKLPQILVEIQFLGLEFAISRLILTVTFMVLLGTLIESIVTNTNISVEPQIQQEPKDN